jgi:hypothetical protein
MTPQQDKAISFLRNLLPEKEFRIAPSKDYTGEPQDDAVLVWWDLADHEGVLIDENGTIDMGGGSFRNPNPGRVEKMVSLWNKEDQ